MTSAFGYMLPEIPLCGGVPAGWGGSGDRGRSPLLEKSIIA